MSLFSYELSMTWITVFYDLYDNVIFLNLHAPVTGCWPAVVRARYTKPRR